MTEHKDFLGRVIEVGDEVVYSTTYTGLYSSKVKALLPKTVRLESETLRNPREVLIVKKHSE